MWLCSGMPAVCAELWGHVGAGCCCGRRGAERVCWMSCLRVRKVAVERLVG